MCTMLHTGHGLQQFERKMFGEPLPADPKLSWPGFAFASAISSFTVLAGSDGCSTIMLGNEATSATADKSFSMS
jgi:hypothetical protein